MKLFGHYEEVPVRGSHRTVRVYVPTLFKHILISLAVFFVPFLAIHSAADNLTELREMVLESFHSPICLVFYVIILLLSLATFWANRLWARDARRMVARELEARTGIMWAIGQRSYRRQPSGPGRLVLDTQDAAGNPLRDEIYPVREEACKRYMERYAQVGRGYAWLVELAVLPPEEGPAFEEPPTAGEEAEEKAPVGRRSDFDQMPVFRGEVVEIFCLKQQPYGCYICGSELFPKK